MEIRRIYRFLSLEVWGNIPSYIQRKISAFYTRLYNTSFSRYFITPYSKFHYSDPEYLSKFKPASGADSYQNFQDFFVRKFKEPLRISSTNAWPCEGLLCESDKVEKLPEVKVKKQRRSLRTIFGEGGVNIPEDYYFSNVFLHNRDYHRIHSPVKGHISRIEHIPGDLVLLRPWLYPEDPSHPALRNERYNVDITDEDGRIWFLSIVGGPAVGTVELSEKTFLHSAVDTGQEIAAFHLGSTCCIASPVPTSKKAGNPVKIGEPFQ